MHTPRTGFAMLTVLIALLSPLLRRRLKKSTNTLSSPRLVSAVTRNSTSSKSGTFPTQDQDL